MHVTVASGEKVLNTKTDWNILTLKMFHERQNNLAMLSIANGIAKTIDLECILRDFTNKKARKLFF